MKPIAESVQVNICMSDMYLIQNGLKQADDLLTFNLNSALEYSTRNMQTRQVGLKFSGTHQKADDNFFLYDTNTIKKNTEGSLFMLRELDSTMQMCSLRLPDMNNNCRGQTIRGVPLG